MAEHGTFWWNELATTDVDAARHFYAEVLGWTTQPMPMHDGGTYWIAKSGERGVAGIMLMPKLAPPGTPPHWMAYVAVDDVDAAAARGVEQGGTVEVGPFDVPGVGRICVIRDPQGAYLSLIMVTMEE